MTVISSYVQNKVIQVTNIHEFRASQLHLFILLTSGKECMINAKVKLKYVNLLMFPYFGIFRTRRNAAFIHCQISTERPFHSPAYLGEWTRGLSE